jgi:hypothetical protein
MAPLNEQTLEDFRGDYESVASMMEESWGGGSTPPFLYTPEFLSSCFAHPEARFSLAPTIYHGAQPAAFAAGFPRTIRLDGRDLRIIVVALLTVAKEHKRRGYGIVVWTELVRRARAAGFDGMVNYCVEGEAMNQMIEGSCRRLDLPVIRAFGIHYLSRVIFPKRNAPPIDPLSAGVFLAAAQSISAQVPLVRLWSAAEATWQTTRQGGISAQITDQGSDSVLTGYVMPIANTERTTCLVVEDVLWGSLDATERPTLVKQLIDNAADAGARIAIVPMLAYADTDPFRAAGFRPSNQLVWMYLTIWTGQPRTEPLSSCYLDVF